MKLMFLSIQYMFHNNTFHYFWKKETFRSAFDPHEFGRKAKKHFLFLGPSIPSSRTARERSKEEGRGGEGNEKQREGMEAKRE